MIDLNRRARPLMIAAAALAVVLAAAGAVSAQSPSPAASAAASAPPVASASPVASAPPGASASPVASASPAASAAPSAAASGSPIASVPIALLLPNTTDARWATVDQPAFAAKLTEVCPAAVLNARNAGGDAAAQTQQAQDALAAGARVLVVDPVDAATGVAIVTSARTTGAMVISYDTPITGAAADYHIAFDPAAVGTGVTDAVIASNTEAAAGASPAPTAAPSGAPGSLRVVLIDAPTSNAGAAAWTAAVTTALGTDGAVVQGETAAALTAEEGERIITAALTALGADGFDAVITSDDAVASGVLTGLVAAGIDPATKQVTGGTATIPGVQAVLLGTQLLTTFASPTAQAQLAAVVACGLATGTGLPDGLTTTAVNNGTADIPSLLLMPIPVTIDGSIAGTRSVADTIVAVNAFGADTAALICTADVLAACTDNDITVPSTSPLPSGAPSAVPGAAPSVAPLDAPSTAPVASAAPSPVGSVAP